MERGEGGFWRTLHLGLCVCLGLVPERSHGVAGGGAQCPAASTQTRTGLQFSFPFMALCCCSLCSINLSDAG